MATSPSARKYIMRVWCRMPGTSEATNDSPSPTPITAGGPLRAVTIVSGASAEITLMAYAPVNLRAARRTASSSNMVLPEFSAERISCSMRWAMTSVSVSVTKV